MTRRHVRRATERLAAAKSLVLEEIIPATRNDCLHYAIDHAGRVAFLGTAQQICDRRGTHYGNWVDIRDAGSQSAIELGMSVAKAAAARGYVGLSGLDILTRMDGKAFAIDLNFRPASSSAQILLRDHILEARGRSLSRLSFCSFGGTMDEVTRLIKPFIAANRALPLGAFDPRGYFNKAGAFLRLLAIGNAPEEIDDTLAALNKLGFSIAGWKKRPLLPRILGRLASRLGQVPVC
jgi:hypothetical protein